MENGFGDGLCVLVVDDEPGILVLMTKLLDEDGFTVKTATGFEEAVALWSKTKIDLAIIDKNLPDGSGIDLIRQFSGEEHDFEALLITAYASLESAIEVMRLGFTDYVVKPFGNINEVRMRIRRAAEKLRLRRENRDLVQELKDKNKRLEAMAVRDPLTGLYNHAYFQDHLATEIARCKRYEHQLGLMFIDIDHFKGVNDSLGHQIGDQVLMELAKILQGGSREADFKFRLREHDVAARYGGDEFVLVLPETPKGGAATIAERLRRCVEQHPFGPKVPQLTASIGIAAYPDDADERDSLISAADRALYAAKNGGRNQVVAFSPDLESSDGQVSWRDRASLKRSAALEKAIAEKAFGFVYQPIIRSSDMGTFGFEALCRPRDPIFADPRDLIRTAEHTGKIHELGRVLREAAVAPIPDLPEDQLLFVNLHPQELHDPALVELESFMRPWVKRIVFEITESRKIHDQDRLSKTLRKLHDHGFKIALDDLSSGYMGLDSIARLQPDFIKLNMGIFRGIRESERVRLLVQHFLEYTAQENIQMIAHGIETDEEQELAVHLGFPLLMQGYLFGKGESPFQGS